MEKSINELEVEFVYLISWENRELTSLVRGRLTALLYFRTPPPPFAADDSSWKNAAESFTVALTLTLGGGTKVQ